VTASYTYDALERLAIRTTQNLTPSGTTHYVYDSAGHLLVEASDTGATVREYVWLDDMPLAVVADVDAPTPKLSYSHTHHPGPARTVRRTAGGGWGGGWVPGGRGGGIAPPPPRRTPRPPPPNSP